MPAFSNANDKTAIIAISVIVLFFLKKSIIFTINLLKKQRIIKILLQIKKKVNQHIYGFT